ncbi:MAG: rhodanese-like domain-containing protein [Betaproteobacteria bacterium]|nr:rhodanese-like domain-containing protein [Betaproteobacteria bacterium]
MKTAMLFAAATVVFAMPVTAEQRPYPPAKVSYGDFAALVAEVEPHRRERLVDLDTFLRMSREPGVIILDTRSALRFERIHLKGARHLSFPDFTQENLRKVIPSEETVVLIYCNNNFDGNEVDFASKVFVPRASARSLPQPAHEQSVSPKAQIKAQEKPVMLALNVPTYITLYGYGYRNVYELDELVKVSDSRVSFEGTVVGNK